MSQQAVFCIATSRKQADRIVDHLKTESYSKDHISVLFARKGAARDAPQEQNANAPEGGGDGALGWIAGIGALAIPGVGSFTAAGPMVAALSGAAGGGIAGGLLGLGIPEFEARHYERKVKDGNVLISVHTDDAGDLARARDIFNQAGAQDICTSSEAATRARTAAESVPRPAEAAVA